MEIKKSSSDRYANYPNLIAAFLFIFILSVLHR